MILMYVTCLFSADRLISGMFTDGSKCVTDMPYIIALNASGRVKNVFDPVKCWLRWRRSDEEVH